MIGYFVLFIFVMALSTIFSYVIDTPITKVVPGYTSTSGIGAAAIGIVTAMILLSPRNYPQIMKLWKEKWSR